MTGEECWTHVRRMQTCLGKPEAANAIDDPCLLPARRRHPRLRRHHSAIFGLRLLPSWRSQPALHRAKLCTRE